MVGSPFVVVLPLTAFDILASKHAIIEASPQQFIQCISLPLWISSVKFDIAGPGMIAC